VQIDIRGAGADLRNGLVSFLPVISEGEQSRGSTHRRSACKKRGREGCTRTVPGLGAKKCIFFLFLLRISSHPTHSVDRAHPRSTVPMAEDGPWAFHRRTSEPGTGVITSFIEHHLSTSRGRRRRHPAVMNPASMHPAVTHPAVTHPAVTHPGAMTDTQQAHPRARMSLWLEHR